MSDVLVALLAFLGAGVGSLVAYAATRNATRTEREAREREEWGRRFTSALEAVTSEEPRRRAVGRALLVELLRSPLAHSDDRAAAAAVLESAATAGIDASLRLVSRPPGDVDDIELVTDTDMDERGRGDSDGDQNRLR